MANQTLTDTVCRRLPCPPAGRSKIYFDATVTGLGLRVTARGVKSFTLTYRNRVGRERCCTIGRFPDWSVTQAREQARRLKRDVDLGRDPLGELLADRQAPTVEDLCLRFREEHLPKLRPSTRGDCEAYIRRDVRPALGKVKVADVTHQEIDALHRKISKRAPYAANRVISLLSKMFSLAIRWRWRADNPARGVERNQEQKRTRYLGGDEIERLTAELEKLEDQQAADVIRLLMLTGARSHEVLSMQWNQIDLETGVWTKPGHTTKQKTEHRVPLSEDALEVVARQPRTGFFVFPGDGKTGHRESVRKSWARVRERAKLGECRIHDVRHTFASLLASSGQSLHVIGKMLGHTQPSTTHRYAHLLDEPLRDAAELAAAGVREADAGQGRSPEKVGGLLSL